MTTYFETVNKVRAPLHRPSPDPGLTDTHQPTHSRSSTCPSRTPASTRSSSSRPQKGSSKCLVRAPASPVSQPPAADETSPFDHCTADLLDNPSFAIVQNDMKGNVTVRTVSATAREVSRAFTEG